MVACMLWSDGFYPPIRRPVGSRASGAIESPDYFEDSSRKSIETVDANKSDSAGARV